MTALKHASLVGQDLEQLKPGRSVLRRDDNGVLWTFGSLARDGNWINLTSGGAVTCSLVSRLEYLGELADDGFITCPEGGWSEPPVSKSTPVEVRIDNGEIVTDRASAFDWWCIAAFRPTPAGDLGALQPQGASVPTETEEAAAINHMVSRFLAWRLPENFNPDGGVRFDEERLHPPHWPTGTNLLDWRQAEAMVRHMMEGLER